MNEVYGLFCPNCQSWQQFWTLKRPLPTEVSAIQVGSPKLCLNCQGDLVQRLFKSRIYRWATTQSEAPARKE